MDRDYYGPELYVDELTKFGGKNPYGLPMYRLVLIGKVTRKMAMLWEDWPDDVPMELRHGIVTDPDTGRPVASPYKPISIRAEMREVESYDDPDDYDKWLLERWAPPSIDIPREEWYAAHRCVNGNPDLPMLGPYPDEGRYMWVCGPFDEPPGVSFLQDMISQWNRNKENQDRDIGRYIRLREEQARSDYAKKREKAEQESAYRVQESLSPLMTVSLGAGRWRSAMFERAGFRHEHIGN
jgi:hypothetical protein